VWDKQTHLLADCWRILEEECRGEKVGSSGSSDVKVGEVDRGLQFLSFILWDIIVGHI
jgi:hypothetical protein